MSWRGLARKRVSERAVGSAAGAAKLTRAVEECVGKACRQAGLDPAEVRYEAACFGMSGGPEDKEKLLARILRAEKLIVTHDGLIALSGALFAQWLDVSTRESAMCPIRWPRRRWSFKPIADSVS